LRKHSFRNTFTHFTEDTNPLQIPDKIFQKPSDKIFQKPSWGARRKLTG